MNPDAFKEVTLDFTPIACEHTCGCGNVFVGRGAKGIAAATKAFDEHECGARAQDRESVTIGEGSAG